MLQFHGVLRLLQLHPQPCNKQGCNKVMGPYFLHEWLQQLPVYHADMLCFPSMLKDSRTTGAYTVTVVESLVLSQIVMIAAEKGTIIF